MAISLLTTGDAKIGRSLQDWGNEFVYAMGRDLDFERAKLRGQFTLVLNLICVPSSLGVIENGTIFKRAAREFWSIFAVDYAIFESRSPVQKIAAIRDALVGAVGQVPESRMPESIKQSFCAAAEAAAVRLAAEPDRHPR